MSAKSNKSVKSVNVEVFEVVEFNFNEVDCPIPVDNSASMFQSFIKVLKKLNMFALKVRKAIVKSTDTFVHAVYVAYCNNELTEAKYTEIATIFGAALHRFKAYVKYFADGKYVPNF